MVSAAPMTLAALAARVEALERELGELRRLAPAPTRVASDRDLDGQYGNPIVRYPPRGWRGSPSYTGKRFSECPPEYLEVLAEEKAELAVRPKEGKERFARYDELDAARARGWARRLRAGWKPRTSPSQASGDFPGDPAPPPEADAPPDYELPPAYDYEPPPATTPPDDDVPF